MATPDLLSSPDRVEAILKRSGLDPDVVDALLARASAAFRGATRQHISRVVDDTVTLDADGSWALLLPERPVTSVASVVVDGVTLTEGTDYEWSAAGVLKRLGSWPAKYRSVVVTYTHGYDPVPEDVQEAVAERAALAFTRRPGVLNLQLGATSVGFDKPGATEDWAQAVARYRVAR